MLEQYIPEKNGETAPLTVELTKNPLLEELFGYISESPVDWGKITSIASKSSYLPDQIPGLLGELHLRDILTKAAATFEGRIKLDPIPVGEKTEHFMFLKDVSNRFLAKRLGLQGGEAEYDAIMEVDGLPVVCEVKIRPNTLSKEITRVFKYDYLNRVFAPLQEHYKGDTFGFVLITPPEGRMLNSSLHQNFVQSGGNHITFSTPLLDFKMHALRVHAAQMRH